MDAVTPRHQPVRLRHEIRRRLLTVTAIERVTAQMLRLHFTSPELADFHSPSHDDHIKLFFPGEGDKPEMRDYTPRRFDPAGQTLAIDFALHEAGPATSWAEAAGVGDTLQIGGPRGSTVVPDDFDWYLLIGDETALPAIGRRVEELRAGVPVATFVVGEAQHFDTRAVWTPHWIAREPGSDELESLRKALAGFTLPAGDGFIWIAAEATVARSLRGYIMDERGHPREWTKAAGYWKRGEADAHEKIED
ncbi:siderophore-interacting protein [Tardiphaga sp.]|uniref:siderophore-interacting protein n=1 Tax=Tardiphaga sp. TaxID=1926292 RepID=UPI00260BD97C|nr:siderophore-interacting protein [Tardiphaga sp.]MDB5620323.1 iron-chelator utilization protein [Tardiphaga sp.]